MTLIVKRIWANRWKTEDGKTLKRTCTTVTDSKTGESIGGIQKAEIVVDVDGNDTLVLTIKHDFEFDMEFVADETEVVLVEKEKK